MLQLIRRVAGAARRAVSGRHGPGVGTVAVAAFAVIAAAVAVAAAAPTEARADTIINFPGGGSAVMHDDGSITGTCWIEPDEMSWGGEGTGEDSSTFYASMPDGSTCKGYCLPSYWGWDGHGQYVAPGAGTYPFTAWPNGDGTYRLSADCQNATTTAPWASWGDDCIGWQDVFVPRWTPPLIGGIEIQKASTNPGLTNGNGCYSLEGAVFGVYLNDVCSPDARIATIVTDASGYGRADDLGPGTYFVREDVAPKGYKRDETIHHVPVDGGKITHWDVRDEPDNDPLAMVVSKVDPDTGRPVPQGGASLAGAEFTVSYYANTDGDTSSPTRTWILRTGADGVCRLTDKCKIDGQPDFYLSAEGNPIMPVGTISVQETKAPTGYRLPDNNEPTVFVIESEGMFKFIQKGAVLEDRTIEERVQRGGVSLVKEDTQTGGTPQGDADLSGIKFDIISNNDNPVRVGGTEYHKGDRISGFLVTDKSGRASTAADLLPYGSYTIEESETNPSMRKTAGSQDVTISENGQMVAVNQAYKDEVVRGGVRVGKIDHESLLHEPQGSATLEGAVLTITNKSANPVVVNGKRYAPGQVVCELTTGKDGTATTEAETLPYGSYEIREKTAPKGYLPNTAWSKTFQIREDKVIVDKSQPADSVDDQVIRGDFSGVKVGEGTMERLAGVPFVIESKTTGERHVLVTDENGELDTNSWPHSQRTNANDGALERTTDGGWKVKDGATVDTDAGVWFTGYSDLSKNPTPKDDLGALPFDSYTVTEARCAANKDWELVHFDVTIRRDGKVVNIGTLDDEPLPKLHTFAHADGSEEQAVVANGTVRLIDTVSYEHLKANTDHKMTGTLHVRNDDGTDAGALKDAEGNEVTASAEFKTHESEGTVDVTFEFDASLLDGRDLVVFERCTTKDGGDVANHEDISDEEQTVQVKPNLGTTATDPVDGDHEVPSTGTVKVADEVRYTALRIGIEHTVTGTLMDKETGAALTDAVGNAITATKTFVPETPSGSVNIEFTVDGTLLAGKTAVAFETVSRGGRELATHADIEDRDQTVTFPKIGTTATINGGKAAEAAVTLAVHDEVAYENLVAGQEYTLSGTLMDKVTGEAVRGADDKPVTASTTIKPENPTGTVGLDLTFDAREFGDSDLVVFEKLTKGGENGGQEVASHEDINDEGQTVSVKPKIGTTATDGADGDHEVPSTGTVTVVDEVRYEGLRPGREYTVSGTLMDKSTGEAILGADGKPVTATKTIKPEKGSGSTSIAFTFDGTLLAGKTVVAFEKVTREGIEVATHADINDRDQTVTFPKIGTTANAETTEADGRETVTVTDKVAYENLVPGTEYTVSGTLHAKAVSKPTYKAEDIITALDKMGIKIPDADGLRGILSGYLPGMEAGIVGTDADGKDILVGLTFDEDGKVAINATIGEGEAARTVSGTSVTKQAEDAAKDGDEEVTDKDGKPVTASTTFTPDAANGTVDVTFTYDRELTSGKSVVVFEELHKDKEKVAEHKDINDEAQTYETPSVHTTATDAEDGDKNLASVGTVKIVDEVRYEGVIIGREYTVSGTLMDKSTGEPVKGANGDVVTASKTFTAASPNGAVTLEFELDGSLVKGKTIVVFEDLLRDDKKVATHADLNDEDQTVYGAKIGTNAKDKADGDKNILGRGNQTIVDTVSYENLVPGQEYTLTGTLQVKGGSGSNGSESTAAKAASDTDGDTKVWVVESDKSYHSLENCIGVASHKDQAKQVTLREAQAAGLAACTLPNCSAKSGVGTNASSGGNQTDAAAAAKAAESAKGTVTFTPKEANGTVDVEIAVNADNLGGKDLVAFETLTTKGSDGKNVTVAEHKDINDEAQTVHVDNPSGSMAKTGVQPIVGVLVLAASIGVAAAAAVKMRSLKA